MTDIVQVIYLRNVGPNRSRQHWRLFMGCAPTLHKQFSYAELAQTDQGNIVEVIFQRKHVCAFWANIAQIIFCAVLSQTCLDSID